MTIIVSLHGLESDFASYCSNQCNVQRSVSFS